MSQIFNRVSRIIKANKNQTEPSLADFYIKSEDDELKSIIDELSKNESQQEEKSKNTSENFSNYSNLNIEEAFLVLDVDKNSTIEEIKIAYKTKIKEYHPDKVSGLGIEIKSLAVKKTQQINAAYNSLKKFKNFN